MAEKDCYSGEPSSNLRCILFTIIVALGYWFIPKKNFIALVCIALFALISMFIYDRMFKCTIGTWYSCLKYVLYMVLLCGLYWVLPAKNKWILLVCLFVPYILLAWHDYWFKCERSMGPTYFAALYSWAKPQESKQIKDYKNLCPDVKKKILIVDIIVVVALLIAAPFFIKWKPK